MGWQSFLCLTTVLTDVILGHIRMIDLFSLLFDF